MENIIKAFEKVAEKDQIIFMKEIFWTKGKLKLHLEPLYKEMNRLLREEMLEGKKEYPLKEGWVFIREVKHEYAKTEYSFHIKKETLLKSVQLFYNKILWLSQNTYWHGKIDFVCPCDNKKYSILFHIGNCKNFITLFEGAKLVEDYEWDNKKQAV